MGVGLAAIGLAPSRADRWRVIAAVRSARMNGYVNVVVIAWVQGRTDPVMLGRTMSFLMLGSVVAAPLSLALAAVVGRHPRDGDVRRRRPARRRRRAIVAIASGLPRRMV